MDLYHGRFVNKKNLICIFSRHKNTFFITSKPCCSAIDSITKKENKEILSNLLNERDLDMTDQHLSNQKVDILKIVAIVMRINLDAVNVKSKRHEEFKKTYWRMRINQNRIRKRNWLVSLKK